MPPEASIRQQTAYLRQVLSQDKKPLAVFVGAGCPVAIKTAEGEPLIPDIAGLTKVVTGALQGDKSTKSAIATVLDHFEKDGRTDFNIETFLSHVRTLRQVVGKAEVRGLNADALSALESVATTVIVTAASQNLPTPGTPYHWLSAWVGVAARTYPVELFTTNYDLLLEQGLEAARVPYFDGFVGSARPFFDIHAIEQDPLPSRWARLWKLHGSINWRENNGTVYRSWDLSTTESRIIHPSHLKYDESRRMPYLVMLDRLRASLQRPSQSIVTCGYSYRDEHVNAIILEGLRANPTATVFGLLHGALANYPIARVPEDLPPNLSLFAADAACIGARQLTWSADNGGSFALGDFREFGAFLRDLIGTPIERDERSTDA
jgi:hypothetical protein